MVFADIDDGEFFISGPALLWKKLDMWSAVCRTDTGDSDLSSPVNVELDTAVFARVEWDDLQAIATALQARVTWEEFVITEKCPGLDVPLCTIPRFPKRLLETLAGVTKGRTGPWGVVPVESITLRWVLSLPYDKIYNESGAAYMPHHSTDGRMMFKAFLSAWGISPSAMGPSYPFEQHSALNCERTEEEVEMSQTQEIDYSSLLNNILSDGDTFVEPLLAPLAAYYGVPSSELSLLHVGAMSWEEFSAFGETLSSRVYAYCCAVSGQADLAWPLFAAEEMTETQEQTDAQAAVQAEVEQDEICSYEQFTETLLSDGGFPIEIQTEAGSVPTEGWTGAFLEGWSEDDVRTAFANAEDADAFISWLRYFDWQNTAGDGAFANALQAAALLIDAEQRNQFFDFVEFLQALPNCKEVIAATAAAFEVQP